MEKQILVPYFFTAGNNSCVVPVTYAIDRVENTLLINCFISAEENSKNNWLGIRKFELKGVLANGFFSQMFSERSNVKTLDANLFIEKAYDLIMMKEKLPILADTPVADLY